MEKNVIILSTGIDTTWLFFSILFRWSGGRVWDIVFSRLHCPPESMEINVMEAKHKTTTIYLSRPIVKKRASMLRTTQEESQLEYMKNERIPDIKTFPYSGSTALFQMPIYSGYS